MRALIATIALAASPAFADMVAKNGQDYVRIQPKPCTAKVEKPQDKGAARVYYQGQHYEACWIVRPDGLVIIFYEDGDQGAIPVVVFEEDKGV
jgi:hypothetical protein